MALSGSRDWSVSNQDVIKATLRDVLGVLEAGESPSADETSDAREALNMIAKAWSGLPNMRNAGFQVWNREATSLNIAAQIKHELKPAGGDANISIPTAIISATLKDTNNVEVVLRPMSEADYYAIGDKTSTSPGTPTRYYYERKLDVGNFYFDCYPSATVQGWTCEILYQQEADDLDFPKEWMRALKYALGEELAPGYLGAIPAWLINKAHQAVLEAQSFHPEAVSQDMYFQPGLD